MWSVWADSVDVYLCRGTVWCHLPGAGAISLRLPATLPLAGQLLRVSELLASHLKRKAVFRIALGARLCPPVCYEVPQGLRWNEQQWLAQKSAAQIWGLNPAEVDQLVCHLSASTVGLAASLPRTTLEVLHHWARSTHKANVASIAPMWAYMIRNSSLNRTAGTALELVESDGTQMRFEGMPSGCSARFVDAHTVADAAVHSGEPERQAPSLFKWSDTLASAELLPGRPWSWDRCFERQTV